MTGAGEAKASQEMWLVSANAGLGRARDLAADRRHAHLLLDPTAAVALRYSSAADLQVVPDPVGGADPSLAFHRPAISQLQASPCCHVGSSSEICTLFYVMLLMLCCEEIGIVLPAWPACTFSISVGWSGVEGMLHAAGFYGPQPLQGPEQSTRVLLPVLVYGAFARPRSGAATAGAADPSQVRIQIPVSILMHS